MPTVTCPSARTPRIERIALSAAEEYARIGSDECDRLCPIEIELATRYCRQVGEPGDFLRLPERRQTPSSGPWCRSVGKRHP
jgi:hypothetical protein